MSYAALIRAYSIVFTDGHARRRTVVEASSLEEARARAATIARGMMDQREPRSEDWSGWRIVGSGDAEEWDDPFPGGSTSQ